MRRIGILNCYGDDNRGSSALNLAAIQAAERLLPGAQIGLVTINSTSQKTREMKFRHTLAMRPKIDLLPPLLRDSSIRFGALSSVPLELLATSVRHRFINEETADFIEACDIVISRGGVVYHSLDSFASYASLLRRTSAMRFAHSLGIPAIHLGLHVMELHHSAGRSTISRDFQSSQCLLPRGPISLEWAHRLAPETPKWMSPDSVFSLTNRLAEHSRKVQPKHWGFVLSNTSHRHLTSILDIVGAAKEAALIDRASVIVQVTGGDSDLEISSQLAKQLSRIVETDLVDEDFSPTELVSLYSGFELMFASRLHAAIFGLLGGTPSFVLPVGDLGGHKALDVYSGVGLPNLVLGLAEKRGWWQIILRTLQEFTRESIEGNVLRAQERHDSLLEMAYESVEQNESISEASLGSDGRQSVNAPQSRKSVRYR